MGPRPGGHGKIAFARAGVAAEVASMGPRPAGHGKTERIYGDENEWQASMGPRPAGHGKAYNHVPTYASNLLQWGRAPRGTESPKVTKGRMGVYMLQWGRAPRGTERWRAAR